MRDLRWWAFLRVPWVWSGWERIYLVFHPVAPVREGSLFGVSRKGDALELHLLSKELNAMRTQSDYSTFKALRVMRGDMSTLASRVRRGNFDAIKEVRAKTLMGEASKALGFHTRPAPRTLANAFQQYFQVGLDAIYHPQGLREHAKRRWPVEIWMTIDELLERYPHHPA